jgi:hypothetical protein
MGLSVVGNATVYWPLVSLCIGGIVLFTVLLETLMHKMDHAFKDGSNYKMMLDQIYTEVMILGLISYLLFMCEQYQVLDVSGNAEQIRWVIAFEFGHILLFYMAVFFIVKSVLVRSPASPPLHHSFPPRRSLPPAARVLPCDTLRGGRAGDVCVPDVFEDLGQAQLANVRGDARALPAPAEKVLRVAMGGTVLPLHRLGVAAAPGPRLAANAAGVQQAVGFAHQLRLRQVHAVCRPAWACCPLATWKASLVALGTPSRAACSSSWTQTRVILDHSPCAAQDEAVEARGPQDPYLDPDVDHHGRCPLRPPAPLALPGRVRPPRATALRRPSPLLPSTVILGRRRCHLIDDGTCVFNDYPAACENATAADDDHRRQLGGAAAPATPCVDDAHRRQLAGAPSPGLPEENAIWMVIAHCSLGWGMFLIAYGIAVGLGLSPRAASGKERPNRLGNPV